MSPMDRSKYPADWDAIAREAIELARSILELCGVEHSLE